MARFYKVTMERTVYHTLTVEADSKEDAHEEVYARWGDGVMEESDQKLVEITSGNEHYKYR